MCGETRGKTLVDNPSHITLATRFLGGKKLVDNPSRIRDALATRFLRGKEKKLVATTSRIWDTLATRFFWGREEV